MKHFKCENCNELGIGSFGKYVSGRFLPVKCKFCKTQYFLKQNKIFMWIYSILDSFVGLFVVIVSIVYRNILFIAVYFFVTFLLYYLIHKSAPLIRKK